VSARPPASFDAPATKRIFTRDARGLVVSALEVKTTVREDLHEQIAEGRRKAEMRGWVRERIRDLREVASYDQRHHPHPPVPTSTDVVVPVALLADAADEAEQRVVRGLLIEVFREEFARDFDLYGDEWRKTSIGPLSVGVVLPSETA